MTFELRTLRPMRNPTRKTVADASSQTGHSGRPRSGPPRQADQTILPSRYAIGGYASGTAVKMSPRLKNQSDTENESSTTRSRFRIVNGLRKSASPIRKIAQRPSQIGRLLISRPPKAPLEPRAIFQATWGPVQASVTAPVSSSTRPVAISPAEPDQTPMAQSRRSLSKVASVTTSSSDSG